MKKKIENADNLFAIISTGIHYYEDEEIICRIIDKYPLIDESDLDFMHTFKDVKGLVETLTKNDLEKSYIIKGKSGIDEFSMTLLEVASNNNYTELSKALKKRLESLEKTPPKNFTQISSSSVFNSESKSPINL